MGVVNVTPDSFFDGGRHADADAALAHARELAAQGADILDLGGESSRPFAEPVSQDEELRRVLPVVRGAAALADTGGTPAISVDTYKAGTAAAALEAGAAIVNDISACAFDPGLPDVLVQYAPGYVLMHSLGRPEEMQNDPRYQDVVEEVLAFFEAKLAALVRAGLPESRVVLDPGIGFGKTLEHNLSLLRNLDRFTALGRPVMVGLSNKSLWGGLLGLEKDRRGNATQAATAVAAVRGATVHRVHDVARTVQTLRVAGALCGQEPERAAEGAAC
jgi:dihydropteroate synthase